MRREVKREKDRQILRLVPMIAWKAGENNYQKGFVTIKMSNSDSPHEK